MVVGWLGRGTIVLHCTHHALSHRLKVLSFFSLFLFCAFHLLMFGQDVELSMAAV